MNDQDFNRGFRAAHVAMVTHCLPHISTIPEGLHPAMERSLTIALLRELCEDFGDNDWPDNLALPDIIENHLSRHLYANLSVEEEG